jgi:hypothetical protein
MRELAALFLDHALAAKLEYMQMDAALCSRSARGERSLWHCSMVRVAAIISCINDYWWFLHIGTPMVATLPFVH